MMAENTEEKKIVGLLPMGLAETNGERAGQKWFSILQKVLVMITIILIAIGFYLLILKLLQGEDSIHNTEIILVSGFHDVDLSQNVSILQDEMKIILQINNQTSKIIPSDRKKRETIYLPYKSEKHKILEGKIKYKDNKFQRAKKIIAEHDVLCNEENHKDTCRELIMKLKSLTENSLSSHNENHETYKNIIKEKNKIEDKEKTIDIRPTDMTKRETNIHSLLKPFDRVHSHEVFGHVRHSMAHPRDVQNPQLPDDCLLKRLMRQSYPNLHGMFDATLPGNQPLIPSFPRQFPSDFVPSFLQNREVETTKLTPHPQDIAIALKFMTPKHKLTSKNASSNATINELECPIGTISCESGNFCIDERNWCDGNVDCDDVTDESRCSCKSRVDESRICDGYFDCPFGEDEMGCFGCSEDTFSCEDVSNSKSTCFSKEQRCNNIADCPNHKDEIDCTMLAPSLHNKPLFAVSNTEGYLHRNFKGTWYAVCNNPYMWAHDACRRETGLIIRPPFIQVLPKDPLQKVNYISTSPGGLIQTSNTCLNSSAVYVTCPDLLCGTRILTASQLLKENIAIENHLFGRNKRFLLHGHPYPAMFYGDRPKRYVPNDSGNSEILLNYVGKGKIDEVRVKRAEGRVVGGKPSQPAAWPWMVALYRDGIFHCGGVIINQNWIMSAAHCVNKFWEHYYEVQVGMLRRFSFSPQEQNHRVTHIIVNQNYDQEDMKNDLSLIRVKPGIQFSRWVRPICLPSPEVAGTDWMWGPAPGTICTAVGWGATEERGPDPDHMREVEVPIWERCKHKEDQAGEEICAGLAEGGKDTCQGDSGGPLLCRNPTNTQQWYIAGIVSHGDGCARKDEPGAYTRVSLYVSWIKHHTASKTLPVIQPKQECPGFRCDSGISKCLPKKRMCDKIIDCLDGEDEYNCEIARSPESNLFSNPFTREANDSQDSKQKVNLNIITSNKDNKSESSVESNIISENMSSVTPSSTTSYIIFTSSKDKHTTNSIVQDQNSITINQHVEKPTTSGTPFLVTQDTLQTSSILNKLEDNMQHASTIEIADYSKESDENVEENITMDPIKTTSNKYEDKDQKEINIEVPKYPIESMSSILDKSEKINSELNRAVTTTTPEIEIEDQNPLKIESDDLIQTSTKDIESSLFTSTEATNNQSTINSKNDEKSKELVVELLHDSNTVTETTTEISLNTVTEHISINDQENSESIKIEHNANSNKILDSKDKIIDEIEDIMLTEIQPAKIRRKHLTPTEFRCRRIPQTIPFSARCDRKADCEDGTDELDCICTDYLTAFDKNLICDGNFDCADGQDEIDCYSCEKDYFICRRSQICLDSKYVCDGKQHCPLGEDELDCLTLSNGKHVVYDLNGRPEVNLQGFLTKKHQNNWHIVCEENMTMDQQEEAALHMCRYLGFSSVNRFIIKYINFKEENDSQNRKSKRNVVNITPISFSYKSTRGDLVTNSLEDIQVIKEECVPNITRTCMALYVYCDHSLFTHFEVSQELRSNKETNDLSDHLWPWIAKLYIDGNYKCTGVLIDLSWVLVSHNCLNDAKLGTHYISVVLGSHKTLDSVIGPYEQILQVIGKKDLYRSKIYLLHLKEPAVYSDMVKPMVLVSPYYGDNKNTICVAVGQDNNDKTFSIFLKETDDCDLHNRCFIRMENYTSCYSNDGFKWSGIISCHSKQGWYPAASFELDDRNCDIIMGIDIGNLKHELKFYEEKPLIDSNDQNLLGNCEGVRCKRGACVHLRNVCDGVTSCEDGADESNQACEIKSNLCNDDPHHRGCECPAGQLKCYNGQCINKELFRDGNDDCGDGTDEPGQTTCSDYLSKVMPSRLCDGVLNCHDRSDEDPMFCKCFAKKAYKCSGLSSTEDYCVATDMVCDGIQDCPNGDDERTCMGLRSSRGTPHGIGEVIVRSHGVWHSKCFPTRTHTKSELEAICRDLGFIGGHAKLLETPQSLDPYNSVILDTFSDIALNPNTTIKMRISQTPIARPVFHAKEDCYPVFIECL